MDQTVIVLGFYVTLIALVALGLGYKDEAKEAIKVLSELPKVISQIVRRK